MLPDPKTEWPPEFIKPVYEDIDLWSTYWVGTGARLTNFYSATGSQNTTGRASERTIGGFFRTQTGRGNKRDRADTQDARKWHVPVYADMARIVAGLLYAQPPHVKNPIEDDAEDMGEEPDEDPTLVEDEVEVPEIDPITKLPKPVPPKEPEVVPPPPPDPVQERIDLLINSDTMKSKMMTAFTTWAALGGVAMRVMWDEAVWEDRAFIDVVDPDHCIPHYEYDKLMSILFWSEYKKSGGAVYRWFQDYRHGEIEHALYKGTSNEVGEKVPFTEVGATRHLAEDESIPWKIDEESELPLPVIETGIDEIAAVYIPMQYNPDWRHDDQAKHLGASICSKDVLPLLVALNQIYGSLMNDIEQGKGRVIISENLLEMMGAGAGVGFDPSRSYFAPIAESVDADGSAMLEQVQFNIRVEDHLNSFFFTLKEVLRRVGVSPMDFGLVEAVATTATEVRAWTRDTRITQDSVQRIAGPELSHIFSALIRIDADNFGTGVVLDENVEIQWQPGVEESDQEKATTLGLMETAGAMSLYEKVKYFHRDWDDTQIQNECNKIEAQLEAAKPPMPVVVPPDGDNLPDDQDEEEEAFA